VLLLFDLKSGEFVGCMNLC